jgi:hypothetical protein
MVVGCQEEKKDHYHGLHLNEERKTVDRNKRSVSGMSARARNGLRPYPGLREGMSPHSTENHCRTVPRKFVSRATE